MSPIFVVYLFVLWILWKRATTFSALGTTCRTFIMFLIHKPFSLFIFFILMQISNLISSNTHCICSDTLILKYFDSVWGCFKRYSGSSTDLWKYGIHSKSVKGSLQYPLFSQWELQHHYIPRWLKCGLVKLCFRYTHDHILTCRKSELEPLL
jgi:hypothetical protein